MNKCEECGTEVPCTWKTGICKECDEQFLYCYFKCKKPCRTKEEQKELFDKRKFGWDFSKL